MAKRHYYEAEIFGFCNDPNSVSLDEAKSAYRMLQLHGTGSVKWDVPKMVAKR